MTAVEARPMGGETGNPWVGAAAPSEGPAVPRQLPIGPDTRALWASMRSIATGRPTYPVVVCAGPDGGTGVSTVTAAVGSMMALATRERLVAIDGSPRPWGGLAARIRTGAPSMTFNDLLAFVGGHDPVPWGAAESVTERGAGELRLLAGEERPRPGRPTMHPEALFWSLARLRTAYTMALVDAPPPSDPVCAQALRKARVLTIVCRATPDSVEHTLSWLSWLREAGDERLADGAVVVVNETAPNPSRDVRAGEHRLGRQARVVIRLPFDRALAVAAPIDPLHVAKPTRAALLRIAAAVATGCTTPYPRGESA